MLNEALLKFFKIYASGKCAPYDWSFAEQEAVENIIKLLEEAKQG